MQNSLEVVVLSRNRPEYLIECVGSIIVQLESNFTLTISDNSDNNLCVDKLKSCFPDILYKRREIALNVFDHFNKVIEECKHEYLIIFHDDDMMAPNYLKTISDVAFSNPELAAIGCNSFFMYGDNKNSNLLMGKLKKEIIIDNPLQLVKSYFRITKSNPPPFSSYLYKTSAIKKIFLDRSKGGKHSDVSFLLDILEYGPIYWHPKPLLFYRIHATNDSRVENISDRLSLIRYVKKIGVLKHNSPIIDEYRFKFYYNFIINNLYTINRINVVILKFMALKIVLYLLLIIKMKIK